MDGTQLGELGTDPLIGSEFADRYVIEACVGEGGMGRVYRARHQLMSRKFAIKVLYGDHAADPKMRERFSREAESASRMSHPNLLSVVDFGETEHGLLFLAMDYIEGRELTAVIEAEAPMPAPRVRRILRQLCLGLAHAHEHGLIHRDFKGDNVIVTGKDDDELARIVDFGLAVMPEIPDQRLTTEGMVMGTPAFMSPEQAIGDKLDHRTDLFSLGVVVYHMLAGVLPFDGTPLAIAQQNLSCDPPLIQQRVPGLVVDSALENIARKLMEKSAAKRYQSAREVIAAIDAAEAAEGPASHARPRTATLPEAPRPADWPAPAVAATMPAPAMAAPMPAPVMATTPGPAVDTSTTRLRSRRWARRGLAAALVALIGMAGLGLVWRFGKREHPPAAQTRDAAPGIAIAPEADESGARAGAATTQPDPTVQAAHGADMPDKVQEQAAKTSEPGPVAAASDGQKNRRHESRPDGERQTRASGQDNPRSKEAVEQGAKISEEDLASLYARVGTELGGLNGVSGGKAGKLREDYGAIHLNDSLMNPDLRREAYQKLRTLQRQIRELEKSKE